MLLSWLTVLVYFALCCLELRMGKARSVVYANGKKFLNWVERAVPGYLPMQEPLRLDAATLCYPCLYAGNRPKLSMLLS